MSSKKWISLSLLLAVVLMGAPLLAQEEAAETVTLTGKLVCGKCTLKLEGMEKCQDVLVVEGEDGEDDLYLVAGEPMEEGMEVADVEHTCKGEKAVEMEGTLSEQDGQTWITPTRVEEIGA